MILLNCQHLLQLIVSDTRPGECNIIESKDKGWRHLSRDLGTLQHWFCVSLTIFRPFWLLIVLKALSMMKKSEPPGTGNQVWGWNILFGALAELIMLSVFTRAYEPLGTKQPQSIRIHFHIIQWGIRCISLYVFLFCWQKCWWCAGPNSLILLLFVHTHNANCGTSLEFVDGRFRLLECVMRRSSQSF